MQSLPSVVPLFPLPNVVLFPGVPLPLHIFEPRYHTMVADALKGEDRLIGMVLLRGEWREQYRGNPDVYPVGCAGRIAKVEELADGRYDIVLLGLREFEIQAENRERSYRRATVVWRETTDDRLSGEERQRLLQLVERHLDRRDSAPFRELLSDSSLSDQLLVNLLCYALDFSVVEKQALIEAPSLSGRAVRLAEVIEFSLHQATAGVGSGAKHRFH
jgi:hypothetical protein